MNHNGKPFPALQQANIVLNIVPKSQNNTSSDHYEHSNGQRMYVSIQNVHTLSRLKTLSIGSTLGFVWLTNYQNEKLMDVLIERQFFRNFSIFWMLMTFVDFGPKFGGNHAC